MKNKNKTLLVDFSRYCNKHPEERFWQALRNWSKTTCIYVYKEPTGEGITEDTFYFEGKDK